MAKLFDMDPNNLDHLPKEKYKLFEECSSITHFTKDDAPALLIYNTTLVTLITSQGIGIHQPKFGRAQQNSPERERTRSGRKNAMRHD